jgi:hypothetical protein
MSFSENTVVPTHMTLCWHSKTVCIIDVNHSQFDAHFVVAALVDINTGWCLDQPPELLSKLFVTMVIRRELVNVTIPQYSGPQI